MIIESIKQGVNLTNKNWQVILVEAVVAVIGLAGLFFIITVSLAAVAAVLGDDIANIQDKLPELLVDPVNFISKYIRLALIIFTLFSVFLTVVSVLMLYVLGGKLGVLKNAACDAQHKFKLSLFFKGAKRMFFPLLWLFSIMLPVFLVMAIIIVTGFGIFFIYAYNQPESIFSIFTTSFLSLLIVFLGIVGCLGSLMLTEYTAVAIVVRKDKVFSALKKTLGFIRNKPLSIGLYIVVYASILVISIVFAVLGKLFALLPVIGIIIIIPVQLISSAVQIYLGIVKWGVFIFYYVQNSGGLAHSDTAVSYDI
jgi:hypothetical protein